MISPLALAVALQASPNTYIFIDGDKFAVPNLLFLCSAKAPSTVFTINMVAQNGVNWLRIRPFPKVPWPVEDITIDNAIRPGKVQRTDDRLALSFTANGQSGTTTYKIDFTYVGKFKPTEAQWIDLRVVSPTEDVSAICSPVPAPSPAPSSDKR